jgi:putative transposase
MYNCIMRKTYSGEFKVKAVLEVFREEKTLSQIASDMEVHPNQLGKWKKAAIAGLAEILEDGRRKDEKEVEALKNQIQELYAEIGELTTKLNWLKKNPASEWSRQERFRLIDFEDRSIPLTVQTNLLSLNRTSMYYKPVPPSAREIEVKHAIDRIYTENPYFGSRTLTTVLNREGHKISRATVINYMHEMGICAIFPKRNLSARNPEHKVYPYLLRNITASYPNHIWGTDITYIRLQKGWLYLVAYMDWFSRYVLSWELNHTLEVDFVLEALKNALKIAKPDIVNSDQGSQV